MQTTPIENVNELIAAVSKLRAEIPDNSSYVGWACFNISDYFWNQAKRGKDKFAPYELADLWTRIQGLSAALTEEWDRSAKTAAHESAAVTGVKLAWDVLAAANRAGDYEETRQLLPVLSKLEASLGDALKGESEPIQRFIDALKG
jgi:hypothetical protein